MDRRYRAYYKIHLNANWNIRGWGYRGWDDYGRLYEHNLEVLRQRIKSLKILPCANDDIKENYHLKISCLKEDEECLIIVLEHLEDADYIKI
jgi:hypothetical protein